LYSAGGFNILKIDKNYTDLYCFLFQIGWLGALFGGLSPPKPAMASRLGLEQVNDEGALEIAHEICD